jgi:protein gp37
MCWTDSGTSLGSSGQLDKNELLFYDRGMSEKTRIEWTHATWNPVTGCSHVSAGCEHCYAEALSLRFGWSVRAWTKPNAKVNVVLHPDRLKQPLHWARPRRVFANSMSDLFHEEVPFAFIDQVFEVMLTANWHTYQVLTKRPERMREYVLSRGTAFGDRWPERRVPAHIWLGVSIEEDRWCCRADLLRHTPGMVRFISAEPLLGPLPSLNLHGIHWLIAGGESGPSFRPVDLSWVRELRDLCQREGVAFFFKQVGGRTPKAGGRTLEGRTWDEFPQFVTDREAALSGSRP